MISLITAILAALTGMVPGVLQFFTQKASNAQALAIEQLRQQAAKDGVALQVDLANSQSDIQQQQRLYTFAGSPTGIGWVDGITALVRPYITLVVFHVWIGVEIALIYYGVSKERTLAEVAHAIWDENTQAVFSAIVGFWFGNRMLVHGQQVMAATGAVQPKAVTMPPASIHKVPSAAAIIPDPPGSRT